MGKFGDFIKKHSRKNPPIINQVAEPTTQESEKSLQEQTKDAMKGKIVCKYNTDNNMFTLFPDQHIYDELPGQIKEIDTNNGQKSAAGIKMIIEATPENCELLKNFAEKRLVLPDRTYSYQKRGNQEEKKVIVLKEGEEPVFVDRITANIKLITSWGDQIKEDKKNKILTRGGSSSTLE